MGLGCRRLSQRDAVSRATSFSYITCVPCSLPSRREAMKTCAAPGTQPKPFPSLSVPTSLQPPALVRIKSPPALPSTEEAKPITGY